MRSSGSDRERAYEDARRVFAFDSDRTAVDWNRGPERPCDAFHGAVLRETFDE